MAKASLKSAALAAPAPSLQKHWQSGCPWYFLSWLHLHTAGCLLSHSPPPSLLLNPMPSAASPHEASVAVILTSVMRQPLLGTSQGIGSLGFFTCFRWPRSYHKLQFSLKLDRVAIDHHDNFMQEDRA